MAIFVTNGVPYARLFFLQCGCRGGCVVVEVAIYGSGYCYYLWPWLLLLSQVDLMFSLCDKMICSRN